MRAHFNAYKRELSDVAESRVMPEQTMEREEVDMVSPGTIQGRAATLSAPCSSTAPQTPIPVSVPTPAILPPPPLTASAADDAPGSGPRTASNSFEVGAIQDVRPPLPHVKTLPEEWDLPSKKFLEAEVRRQNTAPIIAHRPFLAAAYAQAHGRHTEVQPRPSSYVLYWA